MKIALLVAMYLLGFIFLVFGLNSFSALHSDASSVWSRWAFYGCAL